MSDFDAVLERLVNDPSFAAELAADPQAALAGYRLDAGEAELLSGQVSADTGGALAAVEDRTSKSSTFGLVHGLTELGPWSEFGTAAGMAAEHVGSRSGFGDAPASWGSGGGMAQPGAVTGLGAAPEAVTGFGSAPDLDGLPPSHSGFGTAPQTGFGEPGHTSAEPEHLAPPKGYHPRIDADGDGHWDKATYYGTKDGGVEIQVDLNGDGRADFIGYDAHADGRVDYADYDKNHDGVFEKRMYDDNGDGWLDRTVFPEH